MHARSITIGILVGAVLFTGTSLVIAWTGPSSSPPNENVDAPITVGAVDQVKDAGLSVDALAVFGNAILSGASRYLNFGTIVGSTGYGFRDNAGTMQFKNSSGTWTNVASSSTSLPTPPSCTGTGKGLQWNGSAWSCTTYTYITACRVCIRQYGNSTTDGPKQCSGWASASSGEQATAVSQWAAGTTFANQAWIQCY